MSKYNDMREAYEARLRARDIDVDHYRSRYLDAIYEKGLAEGKNNIYETIISKLMDGKTLEDSVVFFNGQAYKTQSFVLSRNPGGPDTLTVECVAMDILKGEQQC